MNEYEVQHLSLLNRIATALESIALTNAPAPNFIKPIEAYADFDFTAIGALVRQRDQYGPTDLEWGGYSWTRRSPQNKFGEAIWYSRPIGKNEDGQVKYARLITFKKFTEAEPLPRKVEALVEKKETAPGPVVSPERPEKIVEEPVRSELDEHFGARPAVEVAWPTTEQEFYAWLKSNNLNGKETHDALGVDAKVWLRKHPGMSWADVARQIKAARK